jgi:hypothetical protein
MKVLLVNVVVGYQEQGGPTELPPPLPVLPVGACLRFAQQLGYGVGHSLSRRGPMVGVFFSPQLIGPGRQSIFDQSTGDGVKPSV